jgi:hypothetical protein
MFQFFPPRLLFLEQNQDMVQFQAIHQGCQIFLGTTYQKGENIPNNLRYSKWLQNIPNSRKINQMTVKWTKWPLSIKYTNIYPPKFTQIGIFVLKICRLANLPYIHTYMHAF